jgi:GTPase SAR1 family protein
MASAIDRSYRDTNWQIMVLHWFRGTCEPAELNKRTLFLHGDTGYGKTTFINRLVEGHDVLRANASERYWLSKLKPGYEFVIVDEFRTKDMRVDHGSLLQLTGDPDVTMMRKHREQDTVDIRGTRVILISNFEPPESDAALMRRLLVVEADEQCWEDAATAGIYAIWTHKSTVLLERLCKH